MEQNNPLANQTRPEAQSPQVQAAPGGNPLGKIAPQMQQMGASQPQQQPIPTAAQTTAAVHRFGAIQTAMRNVMEDKAFGRGNIRPKLLDAASMLLGNKILSLSEVMNSIKDIPSDPIQQKAFVQNLYNSAKQAEANVLDHFGAAVKAGLISADEDNDYAEDSHGQYIDGLMKHYKRD